MINQRERNAPYIIFINHKNENDATSLTVRKSITVDFKDRLEIPEELLKIEGFYMEFVTYNESQTIKAEAFLKKINKFTRQKTGLNMYTWNIIKSYEE